MTKARIVPISPPYDREVANLLAKMMPPNAPQEPLYLFRTLAHHPDFMSRMRPFAAGILGHGTIDAHEREMVILRTCARCGAEYEWGVHAAAFAEVADLDEIAVSATLQLDEKSPVSLRDSLLIQLVDELHDSASIGDDLWHAMADHWSDAQLIELILICGWYHTIAFVCNATRVPLEDWALRFH